MRTSGKETQGTLGNPAFRDLSLPPAPLGLLPHTSSSRAKFQHTPLTNSSLLTGLSLPNPPGTLLAVKPAIPDSLGVLSFHSQARDKGCSSLTWM